MKMTNEIGLSENGLTVWSGRAKMDVVHVCACIQKAWPAYLNNCRSACPQFIAVQRIPSHIMHCTHLTCIVDAHFWRTMLHTINMYITKPKTFRYCMWLLKAHAHAQCPCSVFMPDMTIQILDHPNLSPLLSVTVRFLKLFSYASSSTLYSCERVSQSVAGQSFGLA